IAFIQGVARYTGVVALEHGDATPPAAADPKAVRKHEQRIQVNARWSLEILLYQQARSEPCAFTEIDERATHEIHMALTADIVRCGIIPTENVIALVAGQQIH